MKISFLQLLMHFEQKWKRINAINGNCINWVFNENNYTSKSWSRISNRRQIYIRYKLNVIKKFVYLINNQKYLKIYQIAPLAVAPNAKGTRTRVAQTQFAASRRTTPKEAKRNLITRAFKLLIYYQIIILNKNQFILNAFDFDCLTKHHRYSQHKN